MLNPLDLQRLASRIERLQRTSTHDWHPGDALSFRNHLPGGRGQQVLPDPATLRAMDPKEAIPKWQSWLTWAMQCEGLIRDNDPHNPRKVMRDLQRGRVTPQTIPFLRGR